MVKVIEINKRNRRLILSATAAQREWRQVQRERLLDELREGEVRQGKVSSLCAFGAFVDLGGADGLVHLSELSWRRVRHPREVVRVDQEVEVYVLRLDRDKKRIGLSLKRLQPEPWALVEDKYELGQLVEGLVTNVTDFGAFAEIEEGVEGLIHVSELTDGTISHPREVVKRGDMLLLRIIRIDIRRKRLGLSLKRVLESEWAEWAAKLAVHAKEQEERAAEAEEQVEAAEAPAEAIAVEGVEQIEAGLPDEAIEEQEQASLPEVAEEEEAALSPPDLVAQVDEPEGAAELESITAEVPEEEEEPGEPESIAAEIPEEAEEPELLVEDVDEEPALPDPAEVPEVELEQSSLPEAVEPDEPAPVASDEPEEELEQPSLPGATEAAEDIVEAIDPDTVSA
jgi:predicted RNA-binding protein with RPS1 domain